MKKKKLQTETYQGFLTYMDYLAMGEGRTIEINFCYADGYTEAKQKHLDRFYPNNPDAQKYFGVNVDVMSIKSKHAQDTLKGIFRFGKQFYKDIRDAGTEFHFKFHFNYS